MDKIKLLEEEFMISLKGYEQVAYDLFYNNMIYKIEK